MKTTITNISSLAGLLLLLALPPLSSAVAQTTSVDSATAHRLQTKLDQLRTFQNLKGLSATVIIPGKGTWKGVSGVSHATVPIDTSMVFAIGSVSKTFTATAILLLQEDGLLSLSDSIHEFLPAYPNINPNITLKQLLQHTSGIYNYTNNTTWQNAVNNNPSQAMQPTDVLTNYVGAPVFAPGASFQYSNTNFLILGLIIEEVSGMPYHAFVRQRLLNPLQLSSFYVAEQEPAFGVKPHNWSDPQMNGNATDIYNFPLTAVFGTSPADGALVGNAHDLARYAQALFTGQVLQDTSVAQMTSFRATGGTGFNGYGLGLMRYMFMGKPVWGHAGNIAGFAASMFFSTSDSIVVSVLANQDVISPPLALGLLAEAKASLINAAPEALATAPAQLSCYPNPVSSRGTLTYQLPERQQVKLTLRNSLGQEVRVLQNKLQEAGEHSLSVETANLPAGIYFCTLITENHTAVQRWVVAN